MSDPSVATIQITEEPVDTIEVQEEAPDTIELIDQPALNIYSSGAPPFRYLHTQNSASAVWTVQHNLGNPPGGILVLGTDGEEVEGQVTQVSDNVLLITFYEPLSGIAYVS